MYTYIYIYIYIYTYIYTHLYIQAPTARAGTPGPRPSPVRRPGISQDGPHSYFLHGDVYTAVFLSGMFTQDGSLPLGDTGHLTRRPPTPLPGMFIRLSV